MADGGSGCAAGPDGEELSLHDILALYGQPINEEQAWAVCHQCCRSLASGERGSASKRAGEARRVAGPGDVRIYKDGAVRLLFHGAPATVPASCSSAQVIESLGIMIYKALDYGLKENEERELSPPLEQLIDLMTNMEDSDKDSCTDEGYEATEEEEEEEEKGPLQVSSVHGYRDIIRLCSAHLPSPSDAPDHYQAVCRALYTETRELRTFLEKIQSAKENLRKMDGDAVDDPGKDLTELQNADWARFWVQVMRDLRTGVKLKKVQERLYNPLATEYQLTPYEMLMDDIRSKRYKLRKVMVNGDIPPRLKKSAHEVILEFIRSRPPLNPVAARKLKPQTERPQSLHERILEEIKSERKLRPVSPEEIRRSRLDVLSPDAARKASSTLSLANGMSALQNGKPTSQGLFQRKRLQAPTLSELTSSDSEDETVGRRSTSTSSISTPAVEDTSPESVLGKKTPPMFLPISSTPQPERRKHAQRRHSIEKETPTNVRQFLPPSRQNSKSLVEWLSCLLLQIPLHPSLSSLLPLWSSFSLEAFTLALASAVPTLCRRIYLNGQKEEFCYPVECLALTVEEVMHIRQVLVKAELEKFQQYKDIYNALKQGKLCLCCRTKRFSFFTWSYTCQFCKRPVCSQCCKKMRLPSKPYASLPIYSLGPSTSTASLAQELATPTPERGTQRPDLTAEGPGASSQRPEPAAQRPDKPGSSHQRHSFQRTVSRLSKHNEKSSLRDELHLPKELTEDWNTMEVCVDCKKFISDIISSSKHSLSLANKRARLKRKTQSFYMSSPKGSEYRPSERTINEV
ncbi:protein spire homolog 1 isoform X2 [Denticeps clupeoides]|uniref:KIND domain-containing protein n=1 Tax=Denticeps clupeoides TaxID=299321 RepID=A0AAY3ZXM6_9TELE|nr:protein spire homolog 1-like isoform X2 [Denticeps clupeoides]